MGPFYLMLALLIQNTFAEQPIDSDDNQIESRDILKIKLDGDDLLVKDYEGPQDWMDMFAGSDHKVFPTSSAALMAQAALSNKTPEQHLEDIKEVAEEINKYLQSEMATLLSIAVSLTEKDKTDITDNNLRKKRSIETPMDSTQLVMRLLKHIKCNNEYQNIAIEKMMTAQEIADKYGIEFNPDPEIISDLAVAANAQAKEMSQILKDSLDMRNTTENVKTDIQTKCKSNQVNDLKYDNKIPETTTESLFYNEIRHDNPEFSNYNYYYNYPYESQIASPHYHNAPVTPKPTFYDYVYPQEYPYCSMDVYAPVIIPMDDAILSEPELVGEEFEETVSSKVCIDHEEPGLSTVNHVTTYTVTEKSHFRTPQIENLPQQMQYYFFLM